MNSEKDMLHFLNFGSKVGGQMVPKLEIEASQRGSEEMEPACYPKRKGPCRTEGRRAGGNGAERNWKA